VTLSSYAARVNAVICFSLAAVLLFLILVLSVQQSRRPRECGDDDHSDIRGFSHEHDPSGAASVYFA
jgi:hypothetical protein